MNSTTDGDQIISRCSAAARTSQSHNDGPGIADLEVLRLNRMLSDLLDLSRADNHQLAIRQKHLS